MNENKLVRVLGLREAISMTIGTVVGVGLFTCGSAQVGFVGPWIIIFTFLALLVSIWPCLIYGEMSATLPCAGGTYNFANVVSTDFGQTWLDGIILFPLLLSVPERRWPFQITLRFCSSSLG